MTIFPKEVVYPMNNVSYKNGSAGFGNSLLYLLIGGGIGAAFALLFAPKSGVELRSDISDIAHKGYDETLELALKLKEQSGELYQNIKERTDHVYDFASAKFSHAKRALDDAAESAKDSFEGVLQLDDSVAGSKAKGTGRRPASIM